MATLQAKLLTLWPTASIPAARAYAGKIPPSPVKPCASVTLASSDKTLRTNTTEYRTITVSVVVYTDTEAQADTIRQEVQTAYLDAGFTCDEGTVMDIRDGGHEITQSEEPGLSPWQATITLLVSLSKAR